MAQISLIVDSLSNADDLYGDEAQVALTLEAEKFGVEVLEFDTNVDNDVVVMTVSDTPEVVEWMKACSDLTDDEVNALIAEARAANQV
jgi:hypothetical protein